MSFTEDKGYKRKEFWQIWLERGDGDLSFGNIQLEVPERYSSTDAK